MTSEDYTVFSQVGKLTEQIEWLRQESDKRHGDNNARLVLIEHKVDGLWQFRQRIIAIFSALSFASGIAAHLVVENATLVWSILHHGN